MKNKKHDGQGRQGDLLIEVVGKRHAKAKKTPAINGRIILAYGEATGHTHSLDADAADWWKMSEDEQYVSTKRAVKVVHQHHAPIPLEAGKTYRITRQRQYVRKEIQRVAD